MGPVHCCGPARLGRAAKAHALAGAPGSAVFTAPREFGPLSELPVSTFAK